MSFLSLGIFPISPPPILPSLSHSPSLLSLALSLISPPPPLSPLSLSLLSLLSPLFFLSPLSLSLSLSLSALATQYTCMHLFTAVLQHDNLLCSSRLPSPRR